MAQTTGDAEMKPQHNDHDFTPVTGGVDISKYVKHARVAPAVLNASDLDAHIARLLALYPDTKVAFAMRIWDPSIKRQSWRCLMA